MCKFFAFFEGRAVKKTWINSLFHIIMQSYWWVSRVPYRGGERGDISSLVKSPPPLEKFDVITIFLFKNAYNLIKRSMVKFHGLKVKLHLR